MNRENQIIKVASERYADNEMRVPNIYCFKEGAEWADSHPLWRKCEEELPEKDGRYVTVEQDGLGNIDVDATLCVNGRWFPFEADTKIIAWMPFPPYPKFNDKEIEK